MTDKKLISHLKNMNQVAGKFAFLKPEEELCIWYGMAVSVLAAPQAQHGTSYYCNLS